MTALIPDGLPIPAGWDRRGLPAWTYRSPALLALERDRVFLSHWQLVGHEADLPAPGDWLSFDMLGERALVIRGRDGSLRAFHNICRHRGARLVDGGEGHCRGALVCPFHGWVYDLDGRLRGPARPDSFGPDLDRAALSLKPVEMESFHGFLFLRFRPGPQPAVATWLAPYAPVLDAHRAAEALPVRAWGQEIAVNWKSVRDVDNEGYHVPLAHPALNELYGRDYRDVYLDGGLHLSVSTFGDRPGRRWSVRHYLRHAPEQAWLPEGLRRSWVYLGLFPNAVIVLQPEGIGFYRETPLDPRRTRLSGRLYRRAREDRPTRLARYLANRIDRDTSEEDVQLSVWSDESMLSSSFEGFHLSDLEWGLRRHHDGLRRLLPVMRLARAPAEAEAERINDDLICADPASDHHGATANGGGPR